MSIEEASTGLASAAPRSATPYSVSIPQTLGTATRSAYPPPLPVLATAKAQVVAWNGRYRYWPVVTRSIWRPPVASSPSPNNVRTNTMRSPFLPEIFAQSSGFVVLGRSSCSRNS
jgi:hypothetical protein